MKLKLGTIANSTNALNSLLSESFKSIFHFRLLRLSGKILPIAEDYFKALAPIIEKYNGEQAQNGQILFKGEDSQGATNEIAELQNQEIELDIERLKLSDIEDNLASEVPVIKIKEFLMLDWLIDLEG